MSLPFSFKIQSAIFLEIFGKHNYEEDLKNGSNLKTTRACSRRAIGNLSVHEFTSAKTAWITFAGEARRGEARRDETEMVVDRWSMAALNTTVHDADGGSRRNTNGTTVKHRHNSHGEAAQLHHQH